MEKIIKSIEEMKDFADYFLNRLEKQENATIVGLYGDLGSGKTTFTQKVGEVLGIEQIITSPTFVIEKIYKLKNQMYKHLIHIDAYRLESGEELESLGWDEISKDSGNLILIEWPEKVEEILPKDMKKIYFKFIDEETREIKYDEE